MSKLVILSLCILSYIKGFNLVKPQLKCFFKYTSKIRIRYESAKDSVKEKGRRKTTEQQEAWFVLAAIL